MEMPAKSVRLVTELLVVVLCFMCCISHVQEIQALARVRLIAGRMRKKNIVAATSCRKSDPIILFT